MKKKVITFSRLSYFMNLPWSEKSTFFEVFFYLAYSMLLLKTNTFKKLATKLGKPMTESSFELAENDITLSLKFGKAIKKLSQFTPFRSMCFEQALALMCVLNKRKISYTIYLGVSKTETKNGLKAHAWTRVGNVYPTGGKGKEKFTVISTFGSNQ